MILYLIHETQFTQNQLEIWPLKHILKIKQRRTGKFFASTEIALKTMCEGLNATLVVKFFVVEILSECGMFYATLVF